MQGLCSQNGLSNTAGEEIVVTSVFLYKFLNDKFIANLRQFAREIEVDFEEIIKNEVFGFGTKHKEFDNFLGDLLIISLSDKTFLIKDDNGEAHQFKAAHSGGTKQETIIGVSIYNQ